ncbi:hypothetical protein MCEMSE15_01196 [Fimbriimonadaceae bacterium]
MKPQKLWPPYQRFALFVGILGSFGCGNKDAGFGAVEYGFYNAKETVNSKTQNFDYRIKDRFLDYFKEECVFMLTPAICRANGDSLEITFPSESTREKYYLLGFIDSMESSEKVVLRRTGKNELTLRWKSAGPSIVLERYGLSGSK